MSLRFFADNSIPNSIIQALRETGYEVFRLGVYRSARDHSRKKLRVQGGAGYELSWLKKGYSIDSEDLTIIFQAKNYDAIFLSLDEDFADIVKYPPADYKGIIALQIRNDPKNIPPILARLKTYLQAHPEMNHYQGKLLLVEVDKIKVRG
ncbi:MAG: DUF5615 family PIN-like protein [candidate division WOR-3 bacterium]